MSAALRGTPVTRTAPLFWEYGRNEKWFGYPKEPINRSPSVAIRDGKWKLLINPDGSRAELYDVVADELEKTDVAASQPEVVKRLSEQALSWRKSLPSLGISE